MTSLDTAGNAFFYANNLFIGLVNEIIPDKEVFKHEYRVSPLIDGCDEFHMPEEIFEDGVWDLSYLPQSWSGFKNTEDLPETLVPHENRSIAAFIDTYTLEPNLYHRKGNHIFFHSRLYHALCEMKVSLVNKAECINKYAQYTWQPRITIFHDGSNHQLNVQTYIRARYQQIIQEEIDRLDKLLKRWPNDIVLKSKKESLRFKLFKASAFKVESWKFNNNDYYSPDEE